MHDNGLRPWLSRSPSMLPASRPPPPPPPAAAADAAPAASTPVTAIIDAGKTYAPISPSIYGMFVEHIHNIINSGMWAEMLDDRKFYHPVSVQAATTAAPPADDAVRGRGGRRGFGSPRGWSSVGSVNAITMD